MTSDDTNVATLPVVTSIDLPAERILAKALESDLDEVVIIGFRKDGSEYFASSAADGGAVLWHLERAKLKLLRIADREDLVKAVDPEGVVLKFPDRAPDAS